MTHADANGSNLSLLDPDSRERFASRRANSIISKKFDKQLLEPTQISMQILTAPAKIDDRITH